MSDEGALVKIADKIANVRDVEGVHGKRKLPCIFPRIRIFPGDNPYLDCHHIHLFIVQVISALPH